MLSGLTPFLAAFAIAYFLNPSLNRFEARIAPGLSRVAFVGKKLDARAIAVLLTLMSVGAIVVATVLTLVSTVPLAMIANKNFLPEEDESQFGVTMRAPEGVSLEATRIIAARIAGELEEFPEVLYAVTTIGDDAQHEPRDDHAAYAAKVCHLEVRTCSA
jgi:multidrug efflux pump subunit AcrB